MRMRYWYLLALIGGSLISLVPAWFITKLVEHFPSLKPQELSQVSDFLSGELSLIHVIFATIIIFVSPVLEEAIFRGLLWRVASLVFSDKVTWIVTSLLFAAVHMDPIHILGLIPFSFFAGWLKLRTGKLLPSILAHIANNAVAFALMVQ